MTFSLKNVKRLSNKRALPYLNFNLKTSNFACCFKMNPSIKLSLSNYKLFLTTRPTEQRSGYPAFHPCLAFHFTWQANIVNMLEMLKT